MISATPIRSRCLTLLASLAMLAACGSVSTSTSKDEPSIDTVSPDNGSIAGGTMVTLTGKRLNQGTPVVVVGGHLATNVSASSDTQLTFMLPPGDEEGAVVDITVSNDAGFAEKPQAFTYNRQPVVLSISPGLGKSAGGATVTITGRGFMANNAGTATVTIGGGNATSVTVVDDKTITATTGPVMAGTKPFTPLDVTVTNANGSGSLAKGFIVTSPGLIAIDRNTPSRLFHFDLATNSAVQIATASGHLSACALDPASGKIYANSRNQSTGTHDLVVLDPLAGTVTDVGPLNDGSGNHGIGSMVFNGSTLFGLDAGNGPRTNRLVTINTTTGAVTVVGATAQAVINGSSIAVKDANTVYYAGLTNGSLDTIATSTSVKTTGLAFAGGSGGSFRAIGLVNQGGKLYLVEKNNPGGIVYEVDPNTAVLTMLGTISTPASISGVCATPASF